MYKIIKKQSICKVCNRICEIKRDLLIRQWERHDYFDDGWRCKVKGKRLNYYGMPN